MKPTLILIWFAAVCQSASAQQAVESKTSTLDASGSHTMLQMQLSELEQDLHQAKRDINILKDFNEKATIAQKKLDELKTSEKPKVIENIGTTLATLKDLPADTQLAYPTSPVVKNLIDQYGELDYFLFMRYSHFPDLPNAKDPLIAPLLDDIKRDRIFGELRKPKLDELIALLGEFQEEKFKPVPQPPTKQKVERQIEDAITEAKTFPKQFEDTFNTQKSSVKDYFTKAAVAVEAERKRLETLSAQRLKDAENIGKQLDAQSANVNDLIQKLPWLVGMLCILFVGLIFLIKFYPPDLQAEWVASGQVIQLLTVVTLLLIILCLAVTRIIGENTIGTLLGGIGGYVLSQGIGRAAARQASRNTGGTP